jgi:hypothetical protein
VHEAQVLFVGNTTANCISSRGTYLNTSTAQASGIRTKESQIMQGQFTHKLFQE